MAEETSQYKAGVVLGDRQALLAGYNHLRSIAPVEVSFEEYVELMQAVADGRLDVDGEQDQESA